MFGLQGDHAAQKTLQENTNPLLLVGSRAPNPVSWALGHENLRTPLPPLALSMGQRCA